MGTENVAPTGVRVGDRQALGLFVKLRKVSINFVMCLSVRTEQLGFLWIDFHEI
jgi:hypothetical protein